jgi:hypothetical protein
MFLSGLIANPLNTYVNAGTDVIDDEPDNDADTGAKTYDYDSSEKGDCPQGTWYECVAETVETLPSCPLVLCALGIVVPHTVIQQRWVGNLEQGTKKYIITPNLQGTCPDNK